MTYIIVDITNVTWSVVGIGAHGACYTNTINVYV